MEESQGEKGRRSLMTTVGQADNSKEKECGGVSWEGECELLLRKYELEDYEMGSVQEWSPQHQLK